MDTHAVRLDVRARAARHAALAAWAIGLSCFGSAAAVHAAAELDCGTLHDSLAIGEVRTYELTAAPGSEIMIAVGERSGLAGFDPSFTLTDGNGAVLASCSGPNGCNATGTLSGPAPHTVTVFDPGSDAANDFDITVAALSDAFGGRTDCSTPLGCDATTPTTGSLARGEIHSYVLAAEAGSVVMVALAEALDFFNFDPTFTLTNGAGTLLATCTNASGCNGSVTLDGPPPFLLTVFDAGSDVSNTYNLSVAPLSSGFLSSACTIPLSCDTPAPLTASLDEGEIDSYRITAEPGSRLLIGVGETTLRGGFNPSLMVTNGAGDELAFCSAVNGCNTTATLAGQPPYTVTVFDEGSDWPHDYNLSVAPLSDAFSGASGCMKPLGCNSQAPLSATLARGQIDSYRLAAEPGSAVMLAIAEPAPFDGFDPTFTLTDANGVEIASCSAATGCNERATLTGPAPYTVTVFDVGSDVESSYNVSLVPLSNAFPGQIGCTVDVDCSAPLPLTGSLVKGDLASYRLKARAGDVVDVQIAETPATFGFNPTFMLTDGNGNELAACSGTNSCTDRATLSGPTPFTITVYDVGSDSSNGYLLSPSITPCVISSTTTTSTTSTTSTSLGGQSACSLPVTSGPAPKASDCLFILGTAVGSRTCTPACICDPNADTRVTASDALRCLQAAVAQPVTLDCPCQS